MLTNKYMNNTYVKSVVMCFVVALMGAGCASQKNTEITQTPTSKDTAQEERQPIVTTKEEGEQQPEETMETKQMTALLPDRAVDKSELPIIDGTWKTYTNAQHKFSFQYPTRGRYAPEWSVEVLDPQDPKLENGCVKPEADERAGQTKFMVEETAFCVTREMDAGAGQRLLTDSFTTPRVDKIVRISFTKRLSLGDMFDDDKCHGNLVFSSGATCTIFDEALYRAHLNQVVSTYRVE